MRWLLIIASCVCALAGAQTISPESVFTGVPFVKSAQVLEQPRPDFPSEVRLRKFDGRAVVAVLVGTDGWPMRHRVLVTEPPLIFDNFVQNVISEFRFAPLLVAGQPAAYETHLTIIFKP